MPSVLASTKAFGRIARVLVLSLLFGLAFTLRVVDGTAMGDETTPSAADWQPLFDGQTLAGWKATAFGGQGEIYVEQGSMHLEFGSPLTGINYVGGEIPTVDYELRLEAQRLEGTDFFCGLTFPVRDAHCSLIVGGWGGSLVGLSSLDGQDASDNETRQTQSFRAKQWYPIRVQVRSDRIRVWIGEEQVIDQNIVDRKLSLRPEVELSKPLGICAFETRAALRKIEIRKLAVAAE